MAVLTAALLGPSAGAFAQDTRTPPPAQAADEESEEGGEEAGEDEGEGDDAEDATGERQERAQPLYGVIRQPIEYRDGRSTP